MLSRLDLLLTLLQKVRVDERERLGREVLSMQCRDDLLRQDLEDLAGRILSVRLRRHERRSQGEPLENA